MLIVVSPAKKLDFETKAPVKTFSQPIFIDKAQVLINDLRKCTETDISKLMKLSETLAKLNVDRYKSFKVPFTEQNAKQAMYAFKGDTYVGLDADTMSKTEATYANKHLRILSGLYGLLAPLDLIQPYRLEMGTKFSCQNNKNLYEFWQEEITTEINKLLKKEKVLINLASKEYFSAINLKNVAGEVITPVFKEKKGDTYKIVGIFAKRARGMFSRYIIENKITTTEDIKKFNVDGYKFSKKFSSENEYVFIR
jgi:cytoplasmic iron level regulating protein YaaA (DUF328/UPF0246 family)